MKKNFIVYRDWNSLLLKNSQTDLEMIEHLKFLARRMYLFNWKDTGSKQRFALVETIFLKWSFLKQQRFFSSD